MIWIHTQMRRNERAPDTQPIGHMGCSQRASAHTHEIQEERFETDDDDDVDDATQRLSRFLTQILKVNCKCLLHYYMHENESPARSILLMMRRATNT